MSTDPFFSSLEKYLSDEVPFEISEYLDFDEVEVDFTYPEPGSASYNQNCLLIEPGASEETMIDDRNEGESRRTCKRQRTNEEIRRSAFRVKSESEGLDDGFKWRKYGKKAVKDNPNLRNYYRCSNEGCPVKKRVQRDQRDPSYIIISYEGNHNHHAPSTLISSRAPPRNSNTICRFLEKKYSHSCSNE